MLVKEVMTTSVETTQPDRSLQEAAERMKTLNVGPLPVCNADGRLVGMVTDRDITVRAVAARIWGNDGGCPRCDVNGCCFLF